jgi:hypothetical protein
MLFFSGTNVKSHLAVSSSKVNVTFAQLTIGEMLSLFTMTAIEKARAFNNAGASLLEAGHGRAAWDLFKGALEVKLESERSSDQQASPHGEIDTYIRKAEYHIQNLANYRLNNIDTGIDSLLFDYPSMRGGLMPLESSTGCLFDPYISCHPFRIVEDEPSITVAGPSTDLAAKDRMMSATRATTMIIFNLALVDHLYNRSSNHAISLYELASTLMVGEDVGPVGIALINNVGVWCYDNEDVPGSLRCMDHLSSVLRVCNSVNEEERARLESNIQLMLIPPYSASPAA